MPESKASARRTAVAIRRGKVLQMKAAGASYDQIWRAFPEDYRSRSAVIQDVQRALMLTVAEPAAELRALEAARLDMLWVKAMQVLSKTHLAISHGRVVYLREPKCRHEQGMGEPPDPGEPLTDDGPVLYAIRELRQLSESRRKLFGLDAPTQVQVMSDDLIDQEIKRLTTELDAAAAAQAEAAAGAEEAQG